MSSLGDLIEFIRHQLSGLDADKDAVTALQSPIGATDTTIPVIDTGGVSVGIAEVDLEQIRIQSVAAQDGTLTLYPFGRGYRGTTATTHAAGTELRYNPSWPASTVAREINGVLTEIYPFVYAVRSHETTIPYLTPVAVPADTVGIISVWVQPRWDGVWVREDRWDFNPDGNMNAGLWVHNSLGAGAPVRVVYAARPGRFDLNGSIDQDFATATGLDDRVADLLSLGVAKRLAPFIDVSRLSYVTASAQDAGNAKPAGAGSNAVRILQSLYLARLQDEAAVLTKEHPIRVHRTR